MENIEIIFFLLLFSVCLVGFAQKIHIPYPLILILGGAAIGFIPGIHPIYFNPDFVLLIFLPPILYYSAFGISSREFQQNRISIFSLALGLVAFTTLIVGIIFKWLFPQYPWALAFAFGAIVSPPDAIAVTSILKRFAINPRMITLLEGESLINDASAIVIYKISITALLTGFLSFSEGISQFFYVAIGGILIGLICGIVMQTFSKFCLEPVLGVAFSFAIPYATYIAADMINVSGVLAVVVNGLIGARILHTHHSSLRRVLGYACWDVLTILVNCLVFILMGLQVKSIAKEMSFHQMLIYSGYALLITFAMVIIRFFWVYGRAVILYFNALQNKSAEPDRQIFPEAAIIGWSGMRGIVSLAVALSLPFAFSNGAPLEGRNDVIFISFMVILITLLIPGLTLPSLINWLNLPSINKDKNEKYIRNLLTKHTDKTISSLFESNHISQHEYRFLKSYFRSQHKVLEISHEDESGLSNLELARRKVIHSQRLKLMEIWKLKEIDDALLNHFENELDMLETHIARAHLNN